MRHQAAKIPSDDPFVKLLIEHRKPGLAEAAKLGELTRLELCGLQMSDDEAEIIAAFLARDKTVTMLWLDHNDIRTRGASSIAVALESNRTLVWISLNYNQVGNKGAERFASALSSSNVSLRNCVLWNNFVSPVLQERVNFLCKRRNKCFIPEIVRRAALSLVLARRSADFNDMGIFRTCPKEIVKFIAQEVWATRTDPAWIAVVADEEESEDSGSEFVWD